MVAVHPPIVHIPKLVTCANHNNHQYVQDVGRNEQASALVAPAIIIENAANLDRVNASRSSLKKIEVAIREVCSAAGQGSQLAMAPSPFKPADGPQTAIYRGL